MTEDPKPRKRKPTWLIVVRVGGLVAAVSVLEAVPSVLEAAVRAVVEAVADVARRCVW